MDQKDHKSLRVNVEFDHATLVRWSPDSKAFIIHKAVENVVEVYKVTKKPDGWIGPVSKALTFPKVSQFQSLLRATRAYLGAAGGKRGLSSISRP